ncbi:pyruvate ferredoxin oxidoreductase [candidate division WOR-3 bacterium]|nr:pyruvate ferredoxin oxidoreductase [candidate division WOR-3 bacterium]
MPIRALTGNEAMAEAMRQINPDVVAAYPITPATEIVQLFASFVADGLVDTEFVTVESEHSAIAACTGAAAGGARVMTSTSSQGLALMHEILYIAAGLRAPIVICGVNRSMSAPINIHCDHSDTMGSREAGWIQIFAEDAQDAYDLTIQAIRISEEVLLPVIVSTDAFIISHSMQRVDMLEDNEVQEFIGPHRSPYSLFEKTITIGPLDLQDYFFEHKRQEIDAMWKSPPIIEKVAQEFAGKFGRSYGLFEAYQTEDAEQVLIACGSTCGTARVAIDTLREKGVKVGLLKLNTMRPFPHQKLSDLLSKAKLLTVLDRSVTMSTMGGPVYVELRSALYDAPERPLLVDYIYGLGGRDIDVEQIMDVALKGEQIIKKNKVEKPVDYIGLRE